MGEEGETALGVLAREEAVRVVVIVAGTLLLAAAVVLQYRPLVNPADFSQPGEFQQYLDFLAFLGNLLFDFGVALLIIFVLLWSLGRRDRSDGVRIASLAFVAVLIVLWWHSLPLMG